MCHATDVNIRKRVSVQTFESPLVFQYGQGGDLNVFLGQTYYSLYGEAHPDVQVAQAAASAVPVPEAVPMAHQYVPPVDGVSAAALPAEMIPKSEGGPPGMPVQQQLGGAGVGMVRQGGGGGGGGGGGAVMGLQEGYGGGPAAGFAAPPVHASVAVGQPVGQPVAQAVAQQASPAPAPTPRGVILTCPQGCGALSTGVVHRRVRGGSERARDRQRER
jgi:hypothetical protein